MSTLIDRLRDATENDPDLFMEAYEMHGKKGDHEWRQRTLLLIRDRAFLDAASMFAVEGWLFKSGTVNHEDFSCECEYFYENRVYSQAETEANARLAAWLKVLEQAQ